MKKFIVFAVVLALLVPAAAFAKAEFSLGGYLKLETFWDSSQNNAYMYVATPRDNSEAGTHGRFNMRSQESRFNFTIKGPKVFGAVLTGFLEIDFDGQTDNNAVSSSGTWQARVRHAMFRLDWPETQLLMGQYWGMFDNFIPESVMDGPMMQYTTALDRIPQIRVTQKFLGDWLVAGLIGLPLSSSLDNANPYGFSTGSTGADSETPQVQGMLQYSHDWWGKAAYFGHPKPFTASVSAGYQRSVNRYSNDFNPDILGENNYARRANSIVSQKYLAPWMVQGGLFIPVLATHSANLAGTASVMASAFIGQGVEVFGMMGNSSNIFRYAYTATTGTFVYQPVLLPRFGLMAQGQYYFTNQWFVNLAYGLTRCYGVDRQNINALTQDAFAADQFRTMQEVDATVWYRPIQALKFGLQYTYAYSNYFQFTPGAPGDGGASSLTSDKGREHRVEFVGYFFF
jgi:hypothetical protein